MGLSTVCDGWNGTAPAESAESCCSKATAPKVRYNRLVKVVLVALLNTTSDKQNRTDSVSHSCDLVYIHVTCTKHLQQICTSACHMPCYFTNRTSGR